MNVYVFLREGCYASGVYTSREELEKAMHSEYLESREDEDETLDEWLESYGHCIYRIKVNQPLIY